MKNTYQEFKNIQLECLAETIGAYVDSTQNYELSVDEERRLKKFVAQTTDYINGLLPTGHPRIALSDVLQYNHGGHGGFV